MRLLITLLFISPCFFLWAQENQAPKEENTNEMEQMISAMTEIAASEYTLRIDDVREKLEKYIENKKRVCEGSFSTVVLSKRDRETTTDSKPVKLSKEEREVCFRELKQIQQKYISASFEAKKKYLIHIHELRLKELEDSKERALKDLLNSFNKKGRR